MKIVQKTQQKEEREKKKSQISHEKYEQTEKNHHFCLSQIVCHFCFGCFWYGVYVFCVLVKKIVHAISTT